MQFSGKPRDYKMSDKNGEGKKCNYLEYNQGDISYLDRSALSYSQKDG